MLENILNPCHSADAWWQQIIMITIPFLLGFLIAKGTKSNVDNSLNERLLSLNTDLEECQRKNKLRALEPGNVLTASPIEVTKTAVPKIEKSKKDDLKVVEGIGPKIEGLFNAAGIHTFEHLANSTPEQLKEILVAAGSRYQMHDPTTWPAQSNLAEEGKWEELKKWQDELNKGMA